MPPKGYWFLCLCILLPLPQYGQVAFEELSIEAGIDHPGPNHGVAIADYDNDGDEDIYVSRIGAPNLLYRNDGHFRFKEVAQKAGVAHTGNSYTSVWGDLDNDGDPDLYVGNRDQPNVLYRNEGDGTFTEISRMAQVASVGKPRALLLADVDRDGWLDIYVANLGAENVLYRNHGGFRFTNITQSSGAVDRKISMGAVFLDYDNDGDPDLYLTHDNYQPNLLYQNDGTGKFTDVSVASGTQIASMGMGVTAGDINNDGWLDLYITNLSDNVLLLNQGDGTFRNISGPSGTADRGMGWGTVCVDYDQDGWLDIYAVNDSYFLPLANVLYRNLGNLQFEPTEKEQAISSMYASYGTAWADFDRDGRPDIFLVNSGQEGNQLFRNTTSSQNWFQLLLTGQASNRDAIGARIQVFTGQQVQSREVTAGSGYASQSSRVQSFGLGQHNRIDSVRIFWPSGLQEKITDPGVNQLRYRTEGQTESRAAALLELAVFPNPTQDQWNITLSVSATDPIQLSLLDLSGKTVRILVDQWLGVGKHSFTFTPADWGFPKGLYQLVLCQGDQRDSKKVQIN